MVFTRSSGGRRTRGSAASSTPAAFGNDVVNFWTSWQVWNHLAVFCRERLAGQSTPPSLARNWLRFRRHIGSYAAWLPIHAFGEEAPSAEVHQANTLEKPTFEAKGRAVSPIPITPGSSWPDIAIRFLSEERIQINVGQHTETRNYAEMGFEDGRNGKPIRAWTTLLTFAADDGRIPIASLPSHYRPKLEKRVQELRSHLRAVFDMCCRSSESVVF